MMQGTGPDLRDGERLADVRGFQAYLQASGEIALWDGQRHAMIGPNYESLDVAVEMLGHASRASAAHG